MTILSDSGPHQIDPPRPTCSILRSILRRSRIRGDSDQEDHHKSYQQEPLAWALVVYDEREISDPMQRAGLRLLSSAVVPIQAVVRRHLALRQALPQLLAIVILQKALARVFDPKRPQGRP
jgi:hypothetical protein